MLLISGFAQMPIFKRYYIADIPGFGWLADFEVTHVIHYGFAIVFTAVVFYKASRYAMEFSPGKIPFGPLVVRFSASMLIFGILSSGFFLAAKNLPGYRFSKGVISILDVVHLSSVMVFLLLSLAVIIVKRIKTSQT
jgi:predicted membrane protein